MSVLDSILLGFVQGFTEFLPVSSSGHLVLAQRVLGIQNADIFSFDVYVHAGTLVSIVVVFRKEIREILRNVWVAVSRWEIGTAYRENDFFRLGVIVVVGTIPAAVVGLLFRYQVRQAFTDPKLVSMNLVITGLMLFLTRLSRPIGGKKLGVKGAFIVGLGQALAILPGISRMGSTMSVAMYLRMTPLKAARLSFLLSIPVILGAAILETCYFMREGSPVGVAPVVMGTIVSAVTGYVAIRFLLRIAEKGKFSLFAFYCLGIGILGIIFI